MNIRSEFDKCTKNLEDVAKNMDDISKSIDERLKFLEIKEKERELWEENVKKKIEKNASILPDTVLFNVGGKKFATTKSTLMKHESFFSGFLDSGYYFIDRCPKLFGIILNYLRYDTLIINGKSNEETDIILAEFEYYLIQPFPVSWGKVGTNLELSDEGRKVTKINGSCHDNATARAEFGWSRGKHEFKIKLNGITDKSEGTGIHWINFGVTNQEELNQTSYHSPGGTFYHNSYSSKSQQCHSGVLSGAEKPIPPNSIVSLVLDCDKGTLSFSIGNEPPHFVTPVFGLPKNQMLYPCVHLYRMGNSAEFIR